MAEEVEPGMTHIRTALSKQGVKPQYNDFLNNVFRHKTPEAVHLGQKTEARLNIIRGKFDLNNMGREANDKNRLMKEVQAKTLKDTTEMENRAQKRRKLALQARDFQFVQMKEIQKKKMIE